jgi:predicted flap endonuclease-1-like 5' DNA nuclease
MAGQEARTPEKGGGWGSNILEGAVMVFVSPLVVPALVLGLRPVAKTVMKGGLYLTGMVQHLATVTSEGWSAWVAEARGQARAPTAPRRKGDVAKPPEAADLSGALGTDPTLVEAVSDQPQPPAADLQRLTGIGRKYAELLSAAGVASVHALARHHPQTLHVQLRQVNAQQRIVRQAPSLELVAHWITQAQRQESEPRG